MSNARDCCEADAAAFLENAAAEASHTVWQSVILYEPQVCGVRVRKLHIRVMFAYEINVFGRVVGCDVVNGSVFHASHLDQFKNRLTVFASAEADMVSVVGLHKEGQLLAFADESDAIVDFLL